MKYVIYKDINTRWYWALKADDGSIVAECKIGFADRAQAMHSVQVVRVKASRALIFDPLGNLVLNGSDRPR